MLNTVTQTNDSEPVSPKKLLFCWVGGQFSVLVPKRTGRGFLRVPYGHHYDAGLDAVAVAGGCDITGLDGALDFQCGGGIFHGGEEKRRAFESKVVPQLTAHYRMPAEEISAAEFWEHHPIARA